MLFAVLFALLGVFLAGFREGVWRQYSPDDTARWRTEGTTARNTASRSGIPASASANADKDQTSIPRRHAVREAA